MVPGCRARAVEHRRAPPRRSVLRQQNLLLREKLRSPACASDLRWQARHAPCRDAASARPEGLLLWTCSTLWMAGWMRTRALPPIKWVRAGVFVAGAEKKAVASPSEDATSLESWSPRRRLSEGIRALAAS